MRLGAVSYLNVRPLVYGLTEREGVSLRFDVPSECARLLSAGEIDLGMVPSITYLDRPEIRSCRASVSVLKVPLPRWRSTAESRFATCSRSLLIQAPEHRPC